MIELKKNLSLEEKWVGKTVRKHVQQFGLLIGGIFIIIGTIKLFLSAFHLVGLVWILLGAFLFIGAQINPKLFQPIWYYWMKIALAIGTVMTTVLITLSWGMFLFMGVLFKILNKKLIDLRFKDGSSTYWEVRDKKSNDFKLLERQY